MNFSTPDEALSLFDGMPDMTFDLKERTPEAREAYMQGWHAGKRAAAQASKPNLEATAALVAHMNGQLGLWDEVTVGLIDAARSELQTLGLVGKC
jgi:hypothetical protein